MPSDRSCQREARPRAVSRFEFLVAVTVLLCLPPGAGAGNASSPPRTLPGHDDVVLHIDPRRRWATRGLEAAIAGAFRRLASPKCQEVFSDFTDRDGRTLRQKLRATEQTAPNYLALLRYTDGRGQPLCDRGDVLAFTFIGLRSVYVCGRFEAGVLSLRASVREAQEIGLIHEVLHTLGLPENPPTSEAITAQVQRRCGAR